MRIEPANSKFNENGLVSKDSISAIPEHLPLDLDRKFFIIYYSILFYIFANSIGFYNQNPSSSPVLIVGLITSISLALSSLFLILLEQHNDFPKQTTSALYSALYFITALIITISDPQVILFFTNNENVTGNSNFTLLIIHSTIGAKYMIRRKTVFYVLSYSFLVINLALSLKNSISILQMTLMFLLEMAYIYCLGLDIKDFSEVYQVMGSEDVSAFRLDQPTTPMEEILIEIHDGIEKILNISKNTAPGVQRLYKKIVKLFKNIIKKMQFTDNIYQPRLDLITKNMDEEEKIYIEQEFFEGHTIVKKTSEKPILLRKVIEYGMSELSGFLRLIGKEWNFNSFFVAGCSKTPATIIGKYTVKMYGLDETYSISDPVLEKFLLDIEKKYPENPYHNALHGGDVMCSLLFFLTNSGLSDVMNSLEWLACILASICHDVGHPGLNNRFLVMTGHEIALTYNDISVLEMMHASILFSTATSPESNIFFHLSTEKFTQIRKLIIDMILATDMSKHFDIVSYIRTKYNEHSDLNNREIRADLFRICIKSADVGHAAKSIDLHERWCLLIIEEFFKQGDIEKQKGLPISMYCDRNNTNIAKSQSGFIKNIVLGLFNTMNSVLTSHDIEKMCIIQLQLNERYWKSIDKQRNLSSVNKNSEVKEENVIFPLLRKRTTRKGSLPPLYGTQASNNLELIITNN